jgi:LacI family transcriptional regulator
MAKNITIKDIAQEAGVSIALVSFVMNNRIGADGKQKYRVSEATKERILEVARRLEYRPNSAARSLRQGRTHVLGVILSDMGNIFYGTIAHYLEKMANAHGYTVLFGNTEEDPEQFSRLVQSFLEKDVEGFVVVPCQGSKAGMERLMASGRPFVVIDRHHPDYDVPSVYTDNAEAMRQALDAIREQGATKIEMVSYAMRISSMTDREESFREVLGPDAHIYHMPFNITEADADAVVEEVLRKGTDGLIVSSNVPSVAVLKSLFRKGVRIQQDIRIVGFDYSNVYNFFNPPISYILQPLPQIAEQAANYLFRLIDLKENGGDISTVHDKIILKATLK